MNVQNEKNLIIACTGSVATIKLPLLIEKLNAPNKYKLNIKIITTNRAKHFIDYSTIPDDVEILDDAAEWRAWSKRGDPVLHIDLGKWADILLIAPLSANSLAKISLGICDDLLTCVIRAWDLDKPLIFCPAMNTRMYLHPITQEQIGRLVSWGYQQIPPIAKKLMCGDEGNGAMAEVQTITDYILNKLDI